MNIRKQRLFLIAVGVGLIGINSYGMYRMRNLLQTVHHTCRSIAGARQFGLLPCKSTSDRVHAERQPRYELFKRVQEIIAVAKKVREHQEFGVYAERGQANCPGVNPYCDRTQNGLYLRLDGYPTSLGTPWGAVRLMGSGVFRGGAHCKEHLNSEFFKRVKLAFEANSGDVEEDSQLPLGSAERVERVKFYSTNPMTYKRTEISKEALRGLKGSDAIITANYSGCDSIYTVLAVDGNTIPKLQHLPEKPLDPAVAARIKSHGIAGILGGWLENAEKSDPSITEYFKKRCGESDSARHFAAAQWNDFMQCYKNSAATK